MQQLFKTGCAALALACGAAFAGPVLIIRSDDRPTDNPTNQAVANLSAWQAEAGNTVTVTSTLPLSLAGYSQVWDLSFRHAFRNTDSQAYLSYLQQGGRLAMIGDNEFLFADRNRDIRQLIADAGGGSLGSVDVTTPVLQHLHAPFADPLDTAPLRLAAPAYFDGQGRGSWILSAADDSYGTGLAFEEGDLMNATAGRLLTMLDVDFMGDLPDASQERWHQLARSMIADLAADATTGQVPEPSSLALLGLALAAAWQASRRRPMAAVFAGAAALFGTAPALAYSEFGYYTGAFVSAPWPGDPGCVAQGVNPFGRPSCMGLTDYPRVNSSVFLDGRTAGNHGSAMADLASASMRAEAIFPERGDTNPAQGRANLYDTFTVVGALAAPVTVTVTMTIDSTAQGGQHDNGSDLIFSWLSTSSELNGLDAYFQRSAHDPYGDMHAVISTPVTIDDLHRVFRVTGVLAATDPLWHTAWASAHIDILMPEGLSWTSASGVFASAVPEPSAGALWAAGLLVVGAVARRRPIL